MNILMSFDSNYIEKAKTMLFSLNRHNCESINLYLMNHNISDYDLDLFIRYIKRKCNIETFVIDVKKTEIDGLYLGNEHFTIEMYYRIFAQFLIPKKIDRVLWLDADIIVLKDITSFYYQEFDNNMYVVCPDSKNNSLRIKQSKKLLKIPENALYFNSGVMLMNLTKLRSETIREDLISACINLQDRLTYPDQDILNCLYFDKVKFDNWKKYNYQLGDIYEIPNTDKKDIHILHYSGFEKPWNYWQINKASKYYWLIRMQMGNVNEMQIALRSFFKEKREKKHH